ncbi:virion structural protein [Synechococcus phage S-PM2]|uniref:Virion structural protein n=1 Tax=Synechococcus phage S-PM2 TaxID=238854 RepID=Q5GQW6_BPSYP|nr:virion structural protein [Synechococcus phage S-PM2]CAF34151.1 virion structural protein [Synechococcus phage S-PM2]CFW42221.1 virion structural protein [Synechococcus phage S-PM2]
MANEIKKYDSVGGFSVNKDVVITENKDARNLNTLEIKNRFFGDGKRTNYILKGLNTSILAIDNLGTQISLQSSTINFINTYIVGVNNTGGGNYSLKLESVVTCSAAGDVQVLSTFRTIIKDSIPSGETWTVTTFDSGAANRFSYSTTRAGTSSTIKWFASSEIISVSW